MTAGVARAPEGARRRRALGALPLAPAALWFLLFFLGPLLVLVAFSFFEFRDFTWSADLNLDNYLDALTDPGYRTILLRTVSVALVVTVAVLLIAYPFTFVITFAFPRRRQWLYFLVLVTLFGSYLVRIYAWRTILGAEGVINATLLSLGLIGEPIRELLNTPLAVVIALTNFLVPLAVLPIYSAMQNLSPGLLEAGRDLGAGRLHLVRTVALPLTMPGVRVAAAFTFIAAAADFATPALLGGASGRMAGGAIQHEFGSTLDWPLGAALALTLIGVLVLAIGVIWFLLGRLAR
ncbi:MAG: ABC transporter permease [Chloroflexota bacterium]